MIPSKKKSLFAAAVFLYTALFFASCTSVEHADLSSLHDRRASALAARIKDRNKQIQTTKGEGWLTVKHGSRTNRFKLVWVAVHPDRIRATVLDSGIPVETILCSGEQIAFFSHSNSHPTKTYRTGNAPLEKFLAIPLNIKDIISLLTGRIPVKSFDYAFFIDTPDRPRTIVLKKKQNPDSQIVGLDTSQTVRDYTLANHDMTPFYTVFFDRFKTIQSFRVPVEVLIQKKSRKVLLDITSFCVNPPVKEGIFRLTANG